MGYYFLWPGQIDTIRVLYFRVGYSDNHVKNLARWLNGGIDKVSSNLCHVLYEKNLSVIIS